MRKIAWMSVLAAVTVAAGAAAGRGRVDYIEVGAETLTESRESCWAKAIRFADEVVALPAGLW